VQEIDQVINESRERERLINKQMIEIDELKKTNKTLKDQELHNTQRNDQLFERVLNTINDGDVSPTKDFKNSALNNTSQLLSSHMKLIDTEKKIYEQKQAVTNLANELKVKNEKIKELMENVRK